VARAGARAARLLCMAAQRPTSSATERFAIVDEAGNVLGTADNPTQHAGAIVVSGTLAIAQTSARQLVGPFVRDNVAANLTDSRAAVGATGAPQVDLAMARAGYLTAIAAAFTVAPAGSTATITVFRATGSGAAAALDATAVLSITVGATLGRVATFTAGTAALAFAAGDRLGVAITTDGSWTATTSDVSVVLEVETAL
jgi:hypothetical protein